MSKKKFKPIPADKLKEFLHSLPSASDYVYDVYGFEWREEDSYTHRQRMRYAFFRKLDGQWVLEGSV